MRKIPVILVFVLLSTYLSITPAAMAATGVEAYESGYESIRLKQYELLTGQGTYDSDQPDSVIAKKLDQLDALTDQHVNAMNSAADRTYLWEDLRYGANAVVEGELFAGSSTESVAYSYSRLVVMARTYATPGTDWYKKDELADLIIGGMDFLYDNWYNLTRDFSGANWWYLKIDIPGKINNVAVLMYDRLSEAQLQNYMNSIDRYVPTIVDDSPTAASGENVGANAVWKGFRVLLSGALSRNPAKIAEARDKLSESFEYVESGDGMQEDYSFLQHAWNPYNLSYGMSSLTDIVNTLYVLQGTPWYPTDPNLSRVFEWTEKAYEPFIVNGLGMGMVEGRAVARKSASKQSAYNLINTVAKMSTFAPEEYVSRYKSMVKSMMISINLDEYNNYSAILELKLSNDIFTDSSVAVSTRTAEHLRYPGMDRVVHRNEDFTIGLAMHSVRTKNFEANGEYKNGWNIANGMTYVYTDKDKLQFTDNFWFTVDPDKLPGTTVNSRPRPLEINGVSVDMWNEHPYMSKPFIANNPMTWTGGTDLGSYGIAGMQLSGVLNSSINANTAIKELMAQKSWFMFDDEVVALGADISSSEGSNIHTIVENRRLSPEANELFVIDGEEQPAGPLERTVSNAQWMHLDAMGGYYFPQPETMQVARYSRSGNLHAISVHGDPTEPQITENYLSIMKDHGANITGEHYEYVILPARTVQDTEAYASNPDIEVLANSNKIQAVREKELVITAANFWTDEVSAVDKLRVNKKASVMIRQQGDELAVSVSDPTQSNSGTILLEINHSAEALTSADPRIEVISLQPTIMLGVNVNGLKGKSIQIAFAGVGNGKEEAIFLADNDVALAARQVAVKFAINAAQNLLDGSMIGYSNGQYPFSAQTELEEAIALATPVAIDTDLTDSETAEVVRALDIAVQRFKSSEVRTSLQIAVDADTSVQFNNSAGLGIDAEIFVKTDNTGWLGGTRVAFLRFVLGDNAAVVKSAKLAIHTRIAETTTALPPLTIRSVAGNDWSETGMTYSSMPAYSESVVAESTPSSKNQVETEFDITSYIADQLSDGIVSMAVVQVPLLPIIAPNTPNNDNTSPLYRIRSKEGGAATAPRLVIEYETLEGALANAEAAIERIPAEIAAELQAKTIELEGKITAGEALLIQENAEDEEVRAAIVALMTATEVVNDALAAIPPTVPQGLSGATNDNTVLLSWQASADMFGIAGYAVYRNGVELAVTAATDFQDTDVQFNSEYIYSIAAIDTAGNRSELSEQVILTIGQSADLEPPGTPQHVTGVVSGAEVQLNWGASTDNVGVVKYVIYRDDVLLVDVATTRYRDVSPMLGATHAYTVQAIDAAGNVSELSLPAQVFIPIDPDLAARQIIVANAIQVARDVLNGAFIGYEYGQYPPAAKSRLETAIAGIVPYASKEDLNEAEKSDAVRQLDIAVKNFQLSKVRDSLTIIADADTAIRFGTSENHGHAGVLPIKTDTSWAGGNRVGLLRFVLGDNDQVVKNVKLVFQGSVNDSNPSAVVPPITIRALTDSNWSETGVTHNDMPDYIGDVLAESTPSGRGQVETEFDITNYVAENLASGIVSMAIVQKAMTDENPNLFYQVTTKEAVYSTANPPRLIIEYDLPATLEAAMMKAVEAINRIPAATPDHLWEPRESLLESMHRAEELLASHEAADEAIIQSIAALKVLTDQVNDGIAGIPPVNSPTVPQNVTGSVYEQAILLSWQAVEDVSEIAGYTVYRNDEEWATTTGVEFLDTNVVPGIAYNYTVAALDNAGNRSALSQSVQIIIPAVQDPEQSTDSNNPSSPPSPVVPIEPHILALNAEQLKQAVSKNSDIVLENGKTELLLPANVGELLQGHRLSIQSKGLHLSIPSTVWGISNEEEEDAGQFALSVGIATEQPGDQHLGSQQRLGSPIFNLTLAFRTSEITKEVASFVEPLKLTLKVDADKVDDRLIGIYRYDEQKGLWTFIRGKYNVLLQEAEVEISRPGQYAVLEYDKSFEDVSEEHWLHMSLKVLTSQHLVYGVTDESFMPKQVATRADFVTLLVRALNIPPAVLGENVFEDVAAEAWFHDSVQSAHAAGLIEGHSDGTFGPEERLTREQLAVLLVRAYEWYTGSSIVVSKELGSFADGGNVSAWAQSHVDKAVTVGIMKGQNAQYFNPLAYATRADTAQAIYNLLQQWD